MALSDRELLNIIENEERRALGWGDGELNIERETLLNYYNQEVYGNEVEGRSQVVTSEVQDTVEWILPSLMRMFTGSDKAVEFEPERPNDEEPCKQATDACNYVFYKQNNGFLTLYSFFKDALIQKNGYVKVYYEKKDRVRKESYQGLTIEQLVMLQQDSAAKIVAATAYPDPSVPQMDPMAMAVGGVMGAQPAPQLYDVQIEVTEEHGKVCVDPIPPEEMLVSPDLNTVDLQKSAFVAQRCEKTLSELKEMGYEFEDSEVLGSSDDHLETSPERLARRRYDEESLSEFDTMVNKPMRKVWVTEAYIRVDYDGDGLVELRKVVKAGKKILEHEDAEVIPFAAITPVIMTHRHVGKSVAEMVADLQIIKSTITRQVLDNVYQTNAPRHAVLTSKDGEAMANLDDLLTVRMGGIVREYAPEAVRPLAVPFMGQHGLAMMQYLDTVKDARVGFTGQFSGLDPDALNKTARGAVMQQNNAMQRIELIARIFAETGVKQLFKLMLHCLSKYHGKELIVRLRDEFVAMDPRAWNTQWDMTTNVGLGTGDKDQQLGHLMQIAQMQGAALQMPGGQLLITPQNLYNTASKIVENAGFKNVEDFWTDPQGQPFPPPPPDPAMQKAQVDAQLKQQEFQAGQQEAAAKAMMEQQQSQREMAQKAQESSVEQAMKQQEAMWKQALAEWQAAADMKLEVYKAQLQAELSRQTAESAAKEKDKEEKSEKSEKKSVPDIHVHLPSSKRKIKKEKDGSYTAEDA